MEIHAVTVHVDFKFPIIWLPKNPAVTVVELNRAAWAGENESGVRHTWPSHERIVFRSTPARSRCVDLGAFLGPNHFRNVAAASSKRLTSTHEPPGNFSGGKHVLGNALCNRKHTRPDAPAGRVTAFKKHCWSERASWVKSSVSFAGGDTHRGLFLASARAVRASSLPASYFRMRSSVSLLDSGLPVTS